MTADGVSPAEPRCTCGSGAHPRRCGVHPCAYDLHRMEINIETALEALKRSDTAEAIQLLEWVLSECRPELDEEAP